MELLKDLLLKFSMNFLEACKRLISIDTSPSNGTGEAAFFIKKLAESLGFQVCLQEEIQKGVKEANVICFPGAVKDHVHLMLQTHLDTVDPGSFALWTENDKNPFHMSIHNSRIYGLGVADTKLDFLCKLYGVRDFVGQKAFRDFAVVGTFGKEYNMNGAIRLVRHKVLRSEKVLVGEPTDFDLVHSGKGLANIEITIPFSKEEMKARQTHDETEGQSAQSKIFKGHASHSCQPHLGINAVESLFDFLCQLPHQILVLEMDGGTSHNTIPVQALLEFDLVGLQGMTVNRKILKIYEKIQGLKRDFDKFLDENFDPPMTTLNIGMIRTYSDHIKLMGCVCWPVAVEEDIYLGWMNDLKLFCESLDGAFRVRDYKKPFLENKNSDFTRHCFEIISENDPDSRVVTQPVTCEANVFHKFGMETLVFGPGKREGNSHTFKESIAIDSLHKATAVYKNIVDKICFQ